MDEAMAFRRQGLSHAQIALRLGFSPEGIGAAFRRIGQHGRLGNDLADAERWFWSRVERGDPERCWLWRGTVHHLGYGVVRVQGRQRRAHVVAYILSKGEPLQDVLHVCGTRLCCNPAHLYEGDDKQNAKDRDRHGRTARQGGRANGQAKLTMADIAEIRGSTESRLLADRFGVSKRHIYKIRAGTRWTEPSE